MSDGGAEHAFLTTALQGAVTTLKEQERASAARADASERLSAEIIASMTSGLLVVGLDAEVRILNPAGRRMRGLSDAALDGTFRDLLSPIAPALVSAIEEYQWRLRRPPLRRSRQGRRPIQRPRRQRPGWTRRRSSTPTEPAIFLRGGRLRGGARALSGCDRGRSERRGVAQQSWTGAGARRARGRRAPALRAGHRAEPAALDVSVQPGLRARPDGELGRRQRPITAWHQSSFLTTT